MDKIIDWINGLPKALQVLLAVSVLGAFGFVVYFAVFSDEQEVLIEEPERVLLDVPGATLEEEENSRMETYKRDHLRSTVSASDFWDQLESDGTGGLLVTSDPEDSAGRKAPAGVNGIYLDPSEYSELEIYQINTGARTKEDVDKEHAERKRLEAEEKAAQAVKDKATAAANSDSAYFARMEKAYELAMKYSTVPEQASSQKADEPTDNDTEEVRRIEVPEPASLPDDILSSDGLISSLEQESVGTIYRDGDLTIRPVKATFLKSEKVVAGQRVIMRIKEQMRLSDGTLIPANTHITGICKVGTRLQIEISTINYNGRIYRTDMSVFDNDGTEGIYCPVIEQKKAQKSAGKIAGQAATGIASTAATLFTRNPYVGRIAQSSISELSRTTLSNGSVAVNIAAGYEFYIFENLKKK